MIPWEIEGEEFVNCNCDYGCPCQFGALPTKGNCEAVAGYKIDKGKYGSVRLDGLRAALLAWWPGPVHEGDGRMQVVVDRQADDAQRDALVKIICGGETEPMATVWSVYSTMCPNKVDPVFAPIDLEINISGRTGRISVPGVFETRGEPIRNRTTGKPHRARIDLPNGYEFLLAEVGSASTEAVGDMKLNFEASYGQFAKIHLNNYGIVH